ncbi:MAG: 4Fe-4S dicluster domain-containing protein [Chloroflexota bacterium]
MNLFTVSRSSLDGAVQRMIEDSVVYGVKRKPPRYAFDRLFESQELCLDYDISLLPPTRYLLPPSETLLRYRLAPQSEVSAVTEQTPAVVIGIHPFDLHAVKLLNKVFADDQHDGNYMARRNRTALIGVDCLNPWQYGFAASMGTAVPPDYFYDLWLTDLGDDYLVDVGSSKGQELRSRYLPAATEARDGQARKREQLREEARQKYQLSLDISPPEIARLLARDEVWQSGLWKELGDKCFSCGSCTMVCPTCICFDVRDRMDLGQSQGERYRTWDSCMFLGFARVASGENFRESGEARLRHRLHRKGKYMLERYGELGCVGCGRCVHACLVDIASPVYAFNTLAREVK